MAMSPLYLEGLAAGAALALLTWLLSLRLRNVSIVDSLWSLMFLLQAWIYALGAGHGALAGTRARLMLVLVTVWALRLSGYITWRNLGHGEDRRYQAIRARNEPHFAWKSLYLVFLLQAVLAWIISLPLLGAVRTPALLRRRSGRSTWRAPRCGWSAWCSRQAGTGSWRGSRPRPAARAR